jgi:hypothetical protein
VDTRIWHAPPRRRSGHTKRRKFLSTGLADILIDAGLFVCASYLDQLQFLVALAKLAPPLQSSELPGLPFSPGLMIVVDAPAVLISISSV